MADYVTPFIDKIHTLLTSNFNTELAAIDSTLPTLANAQIFKSRQPFTQKGPMIHMYLAGDNEISDGGLICHRAQIFWNFVTAVRYVDSQPSESKGNDVYKYTTAMLKAIYKGDTNAGKLDGTVNRIWPAAHISVGVDSGTSVVYEEGILWLIDNIEQLTT